MEEATDTIGAEGVVDADVNGIDEILGMVAKNGLLDYVPEDAADIQNELFGIRARGRAFSRGGNSRRSFSGPRSISGRSSFSAAPITRPRAPLSFNANARTGTAPPPTPIPNPKADIEAGGTFPFSCKKIKFNNYNYVG